MQVKRPLVPVDQALARAVLWCSHDPPAAMPSTGYEAIMDTFAPDFSRFWLPAVDRDAERRRDDREDEARRQQKALEELVERVNAARSIV